MRRRAATLLALSVALAACSSDDPSLPVSGVDARFIAEVASYQQVAGEPGRFAVGLIGIGGRWVSFGSARLTFTAPDGSDAEAPAAVSAPFLALPGSPDGGSAPTLTLASDGRGVYAAPDVTFGEPGFWRVDAEVELDGEPESASAVFEVMAEPIAPVVGQPAPSVDHPVLGDGVDEALLDSRALDGAPLPDPELHELSIADALAGGRPALILFSTPVYCASRFCGPITDMVADLARDYADRASFIHVEVYADFESEALNPAAEAWIAVGDGRVLEPWLYLVDAEGIVVGSWDNIATRSEVEAALEALPAP
jgi:hypothetical protein